MRLTMQDLIARARARGFAPSEVGNLRTRLVYWTNAGRALEALPVADAIEDFVEGLRCADTTRKQFRRTLRRAAELVDPSYQRPARSYSRRVNAAWSPMRIEAAEAPAALSGQADGDAPTGAASPLVTRLEAAVERLADAHVAGDASAHVRHELRTVIDRLGHARVAIAAGLRPGDDGSRLDAGQSHAVRRLFVLTECVELGITEEDLDDFRERPLRRGGRHG